MEAEDVIWHVCMSTVIGLGLHKLELAEKMLKKIERPVKFSLYILT